MNNIPIPALLIMSLAAGLITTISKKTYSGKNQKGLFGLLTFNSIYSIVSAVTLAIMGGFSETSVYTVIMGALFGTLTAIQTVATVVALGIGPMAYTNVIISFSTLISALSGALFFGESIGISEVIGMILMVGCFVMANEKSKDDRGGTFKWLLLCLFAMCATGGIGIMQKVHQSSEHRAELNSFLIIAFISSTLISLFICSALLILGKERLTKFTNKRSLALIAAVMVMGGVCAALNNKFNLYLSGVMPSAIFFPLFNGTLLVLSTLTAVLLFRERLSVKKWIGIALGILSVIFLCNPFGL